MRQGSTIRMRFEVPFDATKVKDLKVVFTQEDKPVITKQRKECSIAQDIVVCWISDEESKKFSEGMAYAQVIAKNQEGGWVSRPYKVPVFRLISEGN